MAHKELLNRYFWGNIQVPDNVIDVERLAWRRGSFLGIFRFSTNFWQLRMMLWVSFIGGFSLSLQAPTWVCGWAKYGMLNGLTVFGPKLNYEPDDMFPVLAKWEHWSSVVTDNELMNLQRAQG
jgi:hypothetical protein